jgi:hypothetical protein
LANQCDGNKAIKRKVINFIILKNPCPQLT